MYYVFVRCYIGKRGVTSFCYKGETLAKAIGFARIMIKDLHPYLASIDEIMYSAGKLPHNVGLVPIHKDRLRFF